MKTTNKTMWLTIEVAKTLVGKTISWRAPMDEENWDYEDTPKFFGGNCIIRNVVTEKLEVETISGDRLSYAILENEELQPVNGSETNFSLCPATGDKRTFTYSDLYREVEVIDVKEADEEYADRILEVMLTADKSAKAKNFERYLIKFFKMRILQGDKIQIIKANYDDRTQLSGIYSVKCRKVKNLHISLHFVEHVADMIGFEISERQQTSDNVTLINKSGFKLSATAVED